LRDGVITAVLLGTHQLLGEQAAGDDSLSGGVVSVASQAAGPAAGPFPAPLASTVRGWRMVKGLATPRAQLGGSTRWHRHGGDTFLAGKVPDRVHHRTPDLSGKPGVALAPSPGLQRGQVLNVDDGGTQRPRLVHRPAGGSPGQRVIEAAYPCADPLVLCLQGRVFGGKRCTVQRGRW
jgi:hypothetical protein